MNTPNDLRYTTSDEWVKVDGKIATIGISDYAQDSLSDVVFVEVTPSKGETVQKNDIVATVESVKAAADVNSPITGKVIEINENLPQSPELVNSDPYGKAWMLKIELDKPAELDKLMDAQTYLKFCEDRRH